MEITNEKRREVAKALRNEASFMETFRDWYNDSNVDIELKGNRAYRNIASSVEKWSNFGDHYEETVLKLADLIDRPTCKKEEYDENYWRCSRCGAFVYWDAVKDDRGVIPTRYCPNCGAEVIE